MERSTEPTTAVERVEMTKRIAEADRLFGKRLEGCADSDILRLIDDLATLEAEVESAKTREGLWQGRSNVMREEMQKAQAQNVRLGQALEDLVQAAQWALHELGVPGPDYPASVANAVGLLKSALPTARAALSPASGEEGQ